MFTSHISICSDSDDESIGWSVSYIILSDSEDEDTASPAALAAPSPAYVPASPDYEADPEESLEEDPSEEDPSEEDLMEDDESLLAQAAPAPPTQPPPNIYDPIVQYGEEIPLRHPYRLHYNGSLLMLTSRKMVHSPFTLPLAIEAAIAEEIDATAEDITPVTARIRKKSTASRWMRFQPRIRVWRDEEGPPSTFQIRESSTAPHILPVTGEPIQHTIPLLVARIVRHEDQIHETQDHLEELPLKRFEAMEQDIEGLRDDMMTSQKDVETLQTTLWIAHERISDMEIRLEETKTRLQESEVREIRLSARMRALKHRFGPPGERL
ncbi:hypothetical protein Tco_0970960 [Tanacetum coccineum]